MKNIFVLLVLALVVLATNSMKTSDRMKCWTWNNTNDCHGNGCCWFEDVNECHRCDWRSS